MNDKQYRQNRTKNGICVDCPNKTNGKLRCQECLKRRNKNQRKIRETRKNKSLCRDCGITISNNTSYCENCSLIRKTYWIQLKKIKKQNRICSKCNNITEYDYSICQNCLQKNKIQATLNRRKYLLKNAKNRAKSKNEIFLLTEEDIPEIKKGDMCPILKTEFNFNGTPKNKQYSPSIDKIDPTKPYKEENGKLNIQIISNRANTLKSNASIQEHEKILMFLTSNISICSERCYTDDIKWQLKIKKLINERRRDAKDKNIEYNISNEYFEKILQHIPTVCPILGIKLEINNFKRADNSLSIDRIDPNKGYIEGNIQIISWRANLIKNNGTLEERRMLVEYMRKQQENKNKL